MARRPDIQRRQVATNDATSLANIKPQFNRSASHWLGAFRVHHRNARSAIAFRQYRPTRSHSGREASDYGCGRADAAQSRIGEIPLGNFPAVVTEGSVNYCATVDAQSPHAAYNGRQAYIVKADMSGNRVSSAVIGLVAGGKDFEIVTKMCAKYGLDPRNAS